MKTASESGIRFSPESLVKNVARELGFSEVGIAAVRPSAESNEIFDRWISENKHGDMRYLAGGRDKRHDPGLLLEGARSVVCVALNYFSDDAVKRNQARLRAHDGAFAMYAHGRDYHNVMNGMLHALEERLRTFFPDMRSAVCVDTQPISERDLAIRAGIAWLGKNTCVISRNYGSWIVLGELLTDLDLDFDRPLESMCGTCTRCIDNCPTGALEDAFSLDATKCISYLTIEKRGDIPGDLHDKIGTNVFGCDECQTVCPFNKFTRETIAFAGAPNEIVDMPLSRLATIPDDEFRALTRDSAIRRAKSAGLRRNARIVESNAGDRVD